MVDAIVIRRDLAQLLLTPGLHNEAVPRLEELPGALWDVHVLHGFAGLHTMLPVDNLEVLVLDVAEGSRFFLRLRHYEPYIQYFGRLEASQNNIVHLDMKKSIFVDGILVEYVGSSCS